MSTSSTCVLSGGDSWLRSMVGVGVAAFGTAVGAVVVVGPWSMSWSSVGWISGGAMVVGGAGGVTVVVVGRR